MAAVKAKVLLHTIMAIGIWSTLTSSHSIKMFQTCPSVTPMSSFDVERFLGNWYIIEIFSSINKCMSMNFSRISEDELEVAQRREFMILNELKIDHVNTYTGSLTIDDQSNPAEMTVKWPANIIGSADFKVVDTDYENFALIFECQYVWLLSRRSFAILSRERELDEETIGRLRDKIVEFGVDTAPLTKVDQSNCTSEQDATFTGTIDQNTFALLDNEQIEKIEDTNELIKVLGWEVPEDQKHKTLGAGGPLGGDKEPEKTDKN